MAEQTIGEVLDIYFDELLAEMKRIQMIQKNGGMERVACDICPNCKTRNHHYDVKADVFVCAFC